MKVPVFNLFTGSFNIQKQPAYFYGLLVAFCFILYGNTIPNNYSIDDHLVTNHNKVVEKGFSGLYEIFTTNYISESGIYLDYRPIVKATFAVEYTLFGWNPHISHAINILLYALGCCLILSVLLKLFGKEYFTVLYMGMLLYAAHPIHTEVVASLKSRDEILVMIFIFSSALYFIKYAETTNTRYAIAGFAFFLLSLLSKISGIPFIVLTPVMMFIKNKNIKAAIATGVFLAILTVAYYATLIALLPGLARPYEYVETPLPYLNDWGLRLGTAFYSLLYYIKLLAAPIQLSFYYGVNYIALQPLLSGWPIISILVYTGIALAFIYTWKRSQLLSFMLLVYLAQISMVSNIIMPMPGIVGERVLFIASLAFCVLVAWGINKLGVKPAIQTAAVKANQKKEAAKQVNTSLQLSGNYLQATILLVVLVFYAFETWGRNTAWKDTITLFEADMPHLTESAKANYMMAKEVRRLYRIDPQLTQAKLDSESAKAIHYYNQAIKAYPQYGMALEELGMIYAVELRNNSMAIPLFEKAFAADSSLWRSATNLGKAYQMSGDTASAINWYKKAVQANRENGKALVELGKLYYLQGEKAKALATNDSLIALTPNSPLPYYNYGVYYMLEKDTAKAVQYFEENIRRGEKEKFPYVFLIKYYLQQGDTGNALRVRNIIPQISR